ncbi:hypothetical protein HPB47_002788, partial [Ixodes persulcatus]
DHRARKDLPYWMTKPAWDFNAENSRPTTSFERKYSPENLRSSKLVSFQLPLPSTSNGELSESPGPDAPYCTADVQIPDSIFGAPTPVPFSPPLTSEIHFGRKKQTTDPGSAIHGFCTGQVFSLAAGFAAVILLSVSAKLMADVRLYAGSEDYITTTADPLLKSPSETVLFKTIIERVPHGVREAQRGHYFDRRKSGKYRTVAMKVTSTVAQKPVVQVTSSGGNEGAWRPDIDHGKRFVSAKKDPRCGQFFFTYCPGIVQQTYYKPGEKTCVVTTDDVVHVCNRSPNRFGSLRSCRRACSEQRTPFRRCYDEVLFTSCSRDDVKHTWWFHYAGKCRKWDFQGGECPVAGSAVYKTRLECLGNCSSPYALGQLCSSPQSTTCNTKQLRFPYFAVTLAGGRLACVKASVDRLLTHRCLAGVNRFDSLSDCY